MMIFLYFITYFLNFICINSKNDIFISSLLKKIMPINNYQKLVNKYNINIQILQNNNIINEFFINTSYISNNFPLDFFCSGKFYYLNNNKIDLTLNDNNKLIFLIKSYSILNNYISNNDNLIKYLTRVIIIPKNCTPNIEITAKYCFIDLSIFLIEIEEDIFNQIINKYILNNNTNFSVKIISKKYEVFPHFQLYTIMLIIFLSLLILSYIYIYTYNKIKNNIKVVQHNFYKEINNNINIKICIIFLLFIELGFFYKIEGFIFDYISFFKSLIIIFMIINKAEFINFILNIFYGFGLFLKKSKKYEDLNYNLSLSIILFYIFTNVFVSPLKIPLTFYILSFFIYMPSFLTIAFYSFKNLHFLSKILIKIKKIKNVGQNYSNSIRLKIFIIIIQFIIFLIYLFLFFVLHEYLLFKKGICFEIEKDILFQSLDCFILLLIALIYIPMKYPEGFDLYILIVKDIEKINKISIKSDNYYNSNIPKDKLINDKEIKKFIHNNKRYFTVLNPYNYLDKNNNNNINLIEKNIKMGKLEPF